LVELLPEMPFSWIEFKVGQMGVFAVERADLVPMPSARRCKALADAAPDERDNSFGRLLRVTTFGESHGPAIGCVIDGCPPGVAITPEDFRADLERRATG
jgi:hypothetical protein